jgi:hypothetical protein
MDLEHDNDPLVDMALTIVVDAANAGREGRLGVHWPEVYKKLKKVEATGFANGVASTQNSQPPGAPDPWIPIEEYDRASAGHGDYIDVLIKLKNGGLLMGFYGIGFPPGPPSNRVTPSEKRVWRLSWTHEALDDLGITPTHYMIVKG